MSRIMIPDEDDDDSISTGDESDTDDLTYSGHSASEGDRTKGSSRVVVLERLLTYSTQIP